MGSKRTVALWVVGVLAVSVFGTALAVGATSDWGKAAFGLDTTYSGCLLGGKITKVKGTDSMPERCDSVVNAAGRVARYITWNASGPQGEQGLVGPRGPRGSVGPMGPMGPAGPTDFQHFYATLDPADGQTVDQVVFTHGSVTVLARCSNNIEGNMVYTQDTTINGGYDYAQLVVTSTENGWYVAGYWQTLIAPLDVARVAYGPGGEVVVAVFGVPAGTDVLGHSIGASVMATPAGHVVGFDGESAGLGLNIFGHGCVITGQIWGFTGTPAVGDGS